MSSTNGNNILEFKVNFKVTKNVRKGFLGLRSTSEEFVVLNDVKGRIESGTMTALLGASGCGKTTLLAALSQRLRGNVKSEIRFNGERVDRTKMTNISGFVPQDDVSVDGLTVREHFYFMIELKIPKISPYEKSHLIETSLIKFGLNGGTSLKFLSGGEKRKLSLASELLTKPEILFCDEPTSGLDSFSAFAVMNTLREIAGFSNDPKSFHKSTMPSRICLFSIHQPTSDIFHLFTNIILMNAGRVIFHGTVQEAQNLFISIGLPCPPRYNPAEFYVNRISDPKVADDVIQKVGAQKTVDDFVIASEHSGEVETRARLSWFRQVFLLSHRAILSFLHSPRNYLIELLILILFSLIITAVYSGVSLNSDSAVQDIKGFLVILATEVLFTFVYAVFYLIYEVLPLLRKETGDRLYSLSAYYVSLVLLMIPRVFFETFLYTAIIYFSTDIGRSFSTFVNISISIGLSGVCGMAYGFFLSGLFENFFIGTELSAITDLILLLCSGIYINVKNLPSFLKYISFFFYANETVSIDFWLTIDEIKCNPNPEFLCLSNGTAVLENLSFGTTKLDIYKDYFYIAILTLVLHVLAFIGIRKNVRRTGFY